MTATDVFIACALLCGATCKEPSSPRAGEPLEANADALPATATVAGDAHAAARQTSAPRTTSPPVAATARAFHPDDDPACTELSTLTSEIRLWQVAASPQPHRRKVVALWPTVPEACRGGTYYLIAAELVGRATDSKLTSSDGAVVVQSAADALARGLAAEPDHPRLLAHLAFADDLVPGQAPPLPAGACARARERGGAAWADDVAYVCALAAIHAGDGVAAVTELERVHSAAAFPDLQVRRAQALVLAHKPKEARALAKPAAATLAKGSPRFDLTPAAIDSLKKKLAAL
jgi:hypothetical protein